MRKLFAHLMAVLFVSCGFALGQGLNDGLVAYYPFNGNANDESGNGHNGTVANAILATDRFGNEASCYYFNGLNAFIEAPDSEDFTIESVTVSAHLKLTGANEEQRLVFTNYGSGFQWYTLYTFPDNTSRFQIDDGSQSPDIREAKSFKTGQWLHLVGQYDGDQKTLRLFVDGELVSEEQIDLNETVNPSGNLSIGGAPYSQGQVNRNFEGLIDDVRIYNRALSEEEVTALYNLEKAGPAPPLVQLGALFESPSGEAIVIDATPAAGFPAEFTYQWCFNGFKIPANLGGTASSINIDNLQANEGTWSVIVTNETGSVEQSFEYRVYADSDSDGLSDGYEEVISKTEINNSDTDNDGLADGDEVNTYRTNPNSSDSDSDGFTDLYELETAYDPNSAESTPDAQVNIMTAIEVDFNAALGATYEIQFSTDTIEWTVIEAGIVGEGNAVERLYSRKDFPTGFFRVERTDQ